MLKNIGEPHISINHQVFDPSYFKEDILMVDAGARYGEFGLEFLKVYPNSFVIFIEPEEKALDVLKKKDIKNCVIIPKALWYDNTLLKMYFWDNPQNSIFPKPPCTHMDNKRKKPYEYSKEVETITLKEIIEKYGKIDLLKMNIEGSEYPIIKNTDDKIFKDIAQMTIEAHWGYEKEYNLEYMLNLLKNDFNAEIRETDMGMDQGIIYAKNKYLEMKPLEEIL